ncbi:hypothetical protein ACIBTV_17040 [Micromonospora sp. NPDC049366]|uniref:hypothetical protein n=1 Tax=Micromonospora sp. NPDC049366 TaxID=3364271 RepID=UPI00378DB1B3
MSYRDWARGEGSPRERTSSWADSADQASVDSYGTGRGAPGRRALESGREEPVDAYLPRWAVESGVRRADGAGRHAAPDDDEPVRPRSDGDGWRTTETTSSWQRVRETSWRELPAIGAAPESDHTREWTFDRPQGSGYVGSRRAERAEEPVSGSPSQRRPRRSPAGRPQVTWSGGEDEAAPAPQPDPGRVGRRRRRAADAEDSWSRPAVGSWERATGSAEEPEPAPRAAADPWDRAARRADEVEARPAVDPWDASGVHAWPPGAERWESTTRWEQPDVAARWSEPDSTGQWDRYPDAGGWDRTEPPRSARSDETEGWSWARQDEGFWSGTRLAGDDPRWVDPPTSAPRSPAVTYTAPRPRSAPGAYGPSRRRSEPIGAPRGTGAAVVRRRIDTVAPPGGWGRRLEDDLLDPDPGGPVRPLLFTAACYLVPAVLIFVWLLTLDAGAPAGCVTDISGGGCDSPRAHALGSLVAAAPRFGLALVSSLVVAALLRRVGTTWRATTIALASAVVGGGLSTVIISVVTGQPIG